MERNYEIMLVMRAYLPDNVRNNVYSFIEGLVAEREGKVVLKDVWGKKYMAYEIDGHEEGYYVIYQVELDSSHINEVSKKLGTKDEILRRLITEIDEEEKGVAFGKKLVQKNDENKK
jgi:small subunit ribosomal protein S6